jgi:hypothetical protein
MTRTITTVDAATGVESDTEIPVKIQDAIAGYMAVHFGIAVHSATNTQAGTATSQRGNLCVKFEEYVPLEFRKHYSYFYYGSATSFQSAGRIAVPSAAAEAVVDSWKSDVTFFRAEEVFRDSMGLSGLNFASLFAPDGTLPQGKFTNTHVVWYWPFARTTRPMYPLALLMALPASVDFVSPIPRHAICSYFATVYATTRSEDVHIDPALSDDAIARLVFNGLFHPSLPLLSRPFLHITRNLTMPFMESRLLLKATPDLEKAIGVLIAANVAGDLVTPSQKLVAFFHHMQCAAYNSYLTSIKASVRLVSEPVGAIEENFYDFMWGLIMRNGVMAYARTMSVYAAMAVVSLSYAKDLPHLRVQGASCIGKSTLGVAAENILGVDNIVQEETPASLRSTDPKDQGRIQVFAENNKLCYPRTGSDKEGSSRTNWFLKQLDACATVLHRGEITDSGVQIRLYGGAPPRRVVLASDNAKEGEWEDACKSRFIYDTAHGYNDEPLVLLPNTNARAIFSVDIADQPALCADNAAFCGVIHSARLLLAMETSRIVRPMETKAAAIFIEKLGQLYTPWLTFVSTPRYENHITAHIVISTAISSVKRALDTPPAARALDDIPLHSLFHEASLHTVADAENLIQGLLMCGTLTRATSCFNVMSVFRAAAIAPKTVDLFLPHIKPKTFQKFPLFEVTTSIFGPVSAQKPGQPQGGEALCELVTTLCGYSYNPPIIMHTVNTIRSHSAASVPWISGAPTDAFFSVNTRVLARSFTRWETRVWAAISSIPVCIPVADLAAACPSLSTDDILEGVADMSRLYAGISDKFTVIAYKPEHVHLNLYALASLTGATPFTEACKASTFRISASRAYALFSAVQTIPMGFDAYIELLVGKCHIPVDLDILCLSCNVAAHLVERFSAFPPVHALLSYMVDIQLDALALASPFERTVLAGGFANMRCISSIVPASVEVCPGHLVPCHTPESNSQLCAIQDAIVALAHTVRCTVHDIHNQVIHMFSVAQSIFAFGETLDKELEVACNLYGPVPPGTCTVNGGSVCFSATQLTRIVTCLRPLPATLLDDYLGLSVDCIRIPTCLESPWGTSCFSVIYSPFVGTTYLRRKTNLADFVDVSALRASHRL